jgi:integrase
MSETIITRKHRKVGAEFCGWAKIASIVENAEGDRNKLLALTLMKTGGRVEEVLQLKPSNFDLGISPFSIVVRNMKVQKKWDYADETKAETVKRDTRRSFPVILAEPLTSEWKSMLLQSFETRIKDDRLLFSAWGRTTKMDRRTAYAIVSKLDPGIWPHWFRGMRASELGDDYGFDIMALNSFFGWAKKKDISAERYSTISWRGLEIRMLSALKAKREVEAAYSEPGKVGV